MTYLDALHYIYSFTNYEVSPARAYAPENFDLGRMRNLLAALGDPQSRFRSVHVAGTKGKGSTGALVESVLRQAGLRTGFYTSPHLHTFRERIRVLGEMIGPEEVAKGVEKVEPLAAGIPSLTTFEVMTALAFDYFASKGVEIAVLEVGLGGRLDATNVVSPLVSVITSISYDHVAILGNTLEQIAREKAGIVKPGISVVSSPQSEQAAATIENAAHAAPAPLVEVTASLEFEVAGTKHALLPVESTLEGQKLLWSRRAPGVAADSVPLELPLLGRHQQVNAATALATLCILREGGLAIPDQAVQQGFRSVQWQGRFEILARKPFLVVDGAHNGDSAHQLAETLQVLFPDSSIHFVFGASSDKDIQTIFQELLPRAESIILTRSHNPRAAPVERLAELAGDFSVEVSIAPDVAAGLRVAMERAQPHDVVCVTGSLFVVAEAREAWLSQHGTAVPKDG